MELRRRSRQSHSASAAPLSRVALPSHPGGDLPHQPNTSRSSLSSTSANSAKPPRSLPITQTHLANANQWADGGKGGRRGAALGLTFNPTLNHHTHDRGHKGPGPARPTPPHATFACRRSLPSSSHRLPSPGIVHRLTFCSAPSLLSLRPLLPSRVPNRGVITRLAGRDSRLE